MVERAVLTLDNRIRMPGFTDAASARESAAYQAILSSRREVLESKVAALPESAALAFGRLNPDSGTANDKVNRNSFGGHEDGTCVVNLTASMLNHSCWFNACQQNMEERKPGGYAMRIYANCDIAADEEITISYMSTCPPLPERRAYLRETYGFECTCHACIRPDVGAQLQKVSTMYADFMKSMGQIQRTRLLLGSLTWLKEQERENISKGKEVLRLMRAFGKGVGFMYCGNVCGRLSCLLSIVRPQNWVAEALGFAREARAFQALTYGAFEHADFSVVDRGLASLEELRVAPPPPQDAATVTLDPFWQGFLGLDP